MTQTIQTSINEVGSPKSITDTMCISFSVWGFQEGEGFMAFGLLGSHLDGVEGEEH